jgi:hypothetical protein
MMDEPIKPATLPAHLRPKMPDLPPTIRTMDGMQRGYTIPQAIRVDGNGGVWIDLSAPIVQGPPQAPDAYPVVVERHGPGPAGPGGYVVGLGIAHRKGYAWTPSQMESFDGVKGLEQFVPVVRLC